MKVFNAAREKKYVGFVAGVGSGKSLMGDVIMVDHCIRFPGTRVLIGCRLLEDVKKKIIPEFMKVFGGYVKHYDGTLKEALLFNGSKVAFTHMYDDRKGIKHLDGYNISAIKISQAEECPDIVFSHIKGRMRNTEGGAKKKDHVYYYEGNPKDQTHYIYKKFLKKANKTKEKELCLIQDTYQTVEYDVYEDSDSLFIDLESQDFRWLPIGYKEDISKGNPERWVNRYVKGTWESFSGLIYSNWDQKIHLIDPFGIPRVLPAGYVRVMAIDWGKNNPTACLYMIYNQIDDVYYVYDLYYQSGFSAKDAAINVLKRVVDEQVMCSYIDQSTDADKGVEKIYSIFLKEFKKFRIPLLRAQKSSRSSEALFYQQLNERDDMTLGWCCFKIPNMNPWTFEIEAYAYPKMELGKETKKNPDEKPVDKDNHAMKAAEYVITGTYHKSNVKAIKIPDDPDDGPSYREIWEAQQQGVYQVIPED